MTILNSSGHSQLTPEQVNKANQEAEARAFLKVLKEASDLCCEACQGLNFLQVIRLKKISGLITGTGKDALVPIPIYACADCGHVNKVFLEKLDIPSPDVPEKGIE